MVALHETGVDDTVVGSRSSDTAVALLHDDGEDESSVDAGGAGDGLDAVGHVLNFLVRVVFNVPLSAGTPHGFLIGVEHLLKGREPVAHGRPSIRDFTGTTENGVTALLKGM